MTAGRVTLPSEENFTSETERIARLWGADAIRNSDGTQLDDGVKALHKKIYSAYFPVRGHNDWIRPRITDVPQMYLLTDRVLAVGARLDIPLMDSFFREQLRPNRSADPHQYWEVIDRTTGRVVDGSLWDLDAKQDIVHVRKVVPMHEYTVTFLALIIWDPVEMYNHLTNNWGDREHEIPLDIRDSDTRRFVFDTFRKWLVDNPDTDVVRFTTFFYQFTLIFDQSHREKIVDWFGYGATVSPGALDEFERVKGYRLRPEDFVDGGSYNSTFRIPSKAQRDWIEFISNFVRSNVAQMVEDTHKAGKEAMMFLGDQWIGTEPYRIGFERLGLDAVVGSVGDGVTLRMIADITGVKYTEGRFLPYFFPDAFHEGNDPSSEALGNWRKARRAILRSPIDRMGYGGYLSLADKFPTFINTVSSITDEFRQIHDMTGGRPAASDLTVGIVNSWGTLRTWMAFTVAHALPSQQTEPYYGLLEALSGMRVKVTFLSFEDLLDEGVSPDIDVLVNAGPADTSFSGGDIWQDPRLVTMIRSWVRLGGGFLGLGEPTATSWQGRFFQLADVFGIDEERYQTLSVDKYFPEEENLNFILEDLGPSSVIDFGQPLTNTYPINEQVHILRARNGAVQLATNDYGEGRAVYIAGLPYSATNARLLERSLFYAAHKEEVYRIWSSSNPECEVAVFPASENYCVVNNTSVRQRTAIRLPDGSSCDFDLGPSAIVWHSIQ